MVSIVGGQEQFWIANGWGVIETDVEVFRSAQYREYGMSAFAQALIAKSEWCDGESLQVDAGRILAGTY